MYDSVIEVGMSVSLCMCVYVCVCMYVCVCSSILCVYLHTLILMLAHLLLLSNVFIFYITCFESS